MWGDEEFIKRLYSAVRTVACTDQRSLIFRLGADLPDRIFCTPSIDIYAPNSATSNKPIARILLRERLRDDFNGDVRLKRLSIDPHNHTTYTALLTDSDIDEIETYFKETISHFREYLFDCEVGMPTLPCFRDVRRSA